MRLFFYGIILTEIRKYINELYKIYSKKIQTL